MPNPNSGTSSETPTDTTQNLGDTSKLSFLSNLKSDNEEPDITTDNAEGDDEEQSPQPSPQSRQRRESDTDGNDVESEDTEEDIDSEEPDSEEQEADTEEADTEEEESEPQETQHQRRPTRRDFAGIDKEHVVHFKRMHNDSFAFLKPLYLEYKAAAQKQAELSQNYDKIKDFQFYHHENAYQLSPDYVKLVQDTNMQEELLDHIQNALARVEAGEPFHDVIWNPKTRQWDIDPTEVKPTPEIKAGLQRGLAKTINQVEAARAKQLSVKESFSNKFKSFEAKFEEIDNKAFAVARKNADFVKAEEETLKTFPSEVRGMKVYKSLASAIAMITALNKHVGELNAQLKGKVKRTNLVRRQGPGTGKPAAGKSKNGKQSIEDLVSGLNAHVGRT